MSQQSTLSLSLFGILGSDESDVQPTIAFTGVHRSSDPIPTTVRREKVPKVPTLGTVVFSSVRPPEDAAPEVDPDDGKIEVDFPDDPGQVDEDVDGINYNRSEYNVRGDNEIDVPEDLLISIQSNTEAHSKALRDVMFESASLLFAHDDASNFVEAAMRDCLGLDLELDDSVQEAFPSLARLTVIARLVELQTALPENVRRVLLNRLTARTADEMVLAMNKKVPIPLAALHKQYAATVTKAGIEPDMEVPQNPVGVRASRR